MGVKLSLTGIKGIGERYGLGALAPLLAGSDREQYVIMRVKPRVETRMRGDIEPTTEVVITAVEGVVEPEDVAAIATFMEGLTRRRFGRRPQGEQPAMDLGDDLGDGDDEREGDQGGGEDYVRPAGEDPNAPGELEPDTLHPGDVVTGVSGDEYEILERIHPPLSDEEKADRAGQVDDDRAEPEFVL